MPGPAPKPDDQRRRRNVPTFNWTLLPSEGRTAPAPELPSWREWSDGLRSEWVYWWSTPQATAWDQSGHSLLRWATLLDQVLTAAEPPISAHAQILAIEDRHGFTPAAMLKLRWQVVTDELGDAREQPARPKRARSAKSQTAGLASRLRAVPAPATAEPAKKAPRKRAAKKG